MRRSILHRDRLSKITATRTPPAVTSQAARDVVGYADDIRASLKLRPREEDRRRQQALQRAPDIVRLQYHFGEELGEAEHVVGQ